MIPHFTDHAANERTYLAWVRTAIAIMAFGFLVERFDLFLAYLGRVSLAMVPSGAITLSKVAAPHHLRAAQMVGLALIALGIVIIMGASVRFLHHRKTISSKEEVGYGTVLGDSLLALLLVCFAAFLAIYIYHQGMTLG